MCLEICVRVNRKSLTCFLTWAWDYDFGCLAIIRPFFGVKVYFFCYLFWFLLGSIVKINIDILKKKVYKNEKYNDNKYKVKSDNEFGQIQPEPTRVHLYQCTTKKH